MKKLIRELYLKNRKDLALQVAAISEDEIDKKMFLKGYKYKLIPIGTFEGGYDPLYAKEPKDVKMWRENPPEKGMKFRVELL